MPAKITPLATFSRTQLLFVGFSGIVLLSVFLSIALDNWFFALTPALIVLFYWSIVDFKAVLLFLYATVPLSTLIYLPGGLSMDLPSEPLMVGLMLVTFFHLLTNAGKWERAFLGHPITIVILLHWLWIAISGITGTTPIISLKFLLAKTWYLAAFYVLTGWMLTREKDVKRWFWLILASLVLTTLYIMIRHSAMGFSFSTIARVLAPFYSNHVIYASVLVVFFPFLWYMRLEYRDQPIINLIFWVLIGFFLLAIYLSYTRAAYVALAANIGVYFLLRFRLLAAGFVLVLVIGVISIVQMIEDNAYLELAPNYETTISHEDFGNLLEATYQMEDISTMERLYRWMAGFQMIGARPVVGFGPGSFYEKYKPYTIRSFQTYVSDNPEKSGIHSYYMMTFVEQGLIGFLVFIVLQLILLLYAQKLYHKTSGWDRRLVLMITLSLSSIMIVQLINDLMETDKVGSIFFFCAAMLVCLDLKQQGFSAQKEEETRPDVVPEK